MRRNPFSPIKVPEGFIKEIGVCVREDGRLLKIFADPLDNEWYEDPMDRMPYRMESFEPCLMVPPDTSILFMKFDYGEINGD